MKGHYYLYLKKTVIAIVVIIMISLISGVLFSVGVRVENILMIYMFGVLIIIIGTKEHVYGVVSSILMVGVFNYLFTEPRYTFHVNDENYYISFAIFLVVSYVVTSLTIKLQRQILVSKRMQMISDTLYKVSSGYLYVTGLDQAIRYGIESLQKVQCREYIILIRDDKIDEMVPYGADEEFTISSEIMKAAFWCYTQSTACGKGTDHFPDAAYYFLPIISKGVTYGVVAIDCHSRPLTEDDKKMIHAVLSVIAIAMDREYANMAEQESKLITERERFRNNLLRSISHDLRTPLAGITGSTSFLLESYEEIDKESRETLLRDMLNDSVWLSGLVDNLLNMTRIQDGRLILKYEEEVVDDIVSEVSSRIQSRLGERKMNISIPEDCLTVSVDGQLIIQVLVNLIDNAIKHTPANGDITLLAEEVRVKKKQNQLFVKFSVIDNGTGIEEDIRRHMFESFITTDHKKGDSARGVGLGLSIAQAIIEAHGGVIEGLNNEDEGATVYFMLPNERRESDE